jgi:hypothetical protein
MRRAAAKCVLAGWVIIAVCTMTACSQIGSAKQAVSGLATSVAANVTRSAAAVPAVPSQATAEAASDSASPTPTPSPTSAAPTQTTASATVTTPAPTSAATTAAATPTPSPTATTGGTSSSVSPWVWVAIGAVALIALIVGIIAWTTSARRRRTDATAARRSQVVDAYAKGAALYDAMAAAEVPGALTAADAPARWYDIQRRADDYGQLLYGLRETATDEQDRLNISNVLASLQAVRSAMEAERAARGADPSLAASVRDRLVFFSGALSRLRQPDAGPR